MLPAQLPALCPAMEHNALQKQICDLAHLQDMATLAMQAMVIFDDLDDKLTNHPRLLEAAGIQNREVQRTARLLRAMTDFTHAARDEVKRSLLENLATREEAPSVEKVIVDENADEKEDPDKKIYLDKREEDDKPDHCEEQGKEAKGLDTVAQ